MRRRILDRLMAEGVTVIDPATTYVDDTVTVGADTVLYPGVILEGATAIGAECVVDTGCHVADSRRSATGCCSSRTACSPTSIVEDDAQLGPFCHLRPQSARGRRRPRSATSWS